MTKKDNIKYKQMNRVYVPYWEWEDWLNGMWRKLTKEKEIEYLRKCINFTGNHILYGKAMRKVVIDWPNTMLNNITNTSMNKRAFLGHCACCYEFNCPEYITRLAWKYLTEEQRINADNEAQETIDWWIENRMNYEKENKGIRKDMGRQMLLQWNS